MRKESSMDIQEHITLKMINVLSYRAKMTQLELSKKSQEIEKLLQETGAQKKAPIVTTTYSVMSGVNGSVMDVEILVPLDRQISVPEGFVWKPEFLLTNALKVKHIGNPSNLQNTINTLNSYITEHKLTPISTGYNVTVKEAKTPLDIEQMEVDIYVGISPNIL